MTAEFGTFFLILALLSALMQGAYLLPFPILRRLVPSCLKSAAMLQALFITLAGATLIMLRVDSDFSVLNVAQNSNLTLPLLYKIVGAWGNHEGSMILWVWVLAMFGLVLALRDHAVASAVQAAMGAGFLLFILCTSSPFLRIFPPPADGEALNPLLQDIGLAMHPPMLYLGYVGFSAVFSLAVAGMLENDLDRHWARIAHSWMLVAWSALTLGIGLGSWWAYRVLGWGGFWFWDPVENVSLLPWLSGTALLHANIVLKKRGQLASWVTLLAILTFGLSMIGTFLVRSGALTSVHSFASDPERGLFILIYVTLIIGLALLLFFMRGVQSPTQPMLPFSREGLIVANNLFLLTACATVFLGTTYPMVAQWILGDNLSVGPPYFNDTFLPLMAPALLLAGVVPFIPWENASLRLALKRALPALLAAVVVVILVLALAKTQLALAALGFGVAAWLAVSSLFWLKRGLNVFPAALAHFGLAVLLMGITGMGLWQQQKDVMLSEGDNFDIGGYHLVYNMLTEASGPDYHAMRASFEVTGNGADTMLSPEYRTYAIRDTSTSIAAVYYGLLGDIYLAIGDTTDDGVTAVRVYSNPMIGFIWIGCVLMALSGLFAVLLRRRNYGS